MGAATKISWCDSTFNPWIGCTKISPACANCYAADMMHRWGKDLWGPGKPRQRTSAANWKQPLKWEAEAARTGIRRKVFCGSLCDWLDPEIPIEWLADLLDLIRQTPHLDWLLLTKRPEQWHSRIYGAYTPEVTGDNLPLLQWMSDWLCAWEERRGFSLPPHHMGKTPPANVWIGTTVEDQEMADKRIPELLKIPARVRFLSCEPLLGPIDLAKSAWGQGQPRPPMEVQAGQLTGHPLAGIDWVICGGESGPKARPMHPDWARSLRDQCKAAGVPFFFKQWGEWAPVEVEDARFGEDRNVGHVVDVLPSGDVMDGMDVSCNPRSEAMERIGKARAGHFLDGMELHEFPRVGSEVRNA
jgi:protein gp37